ncbi:MAG: NUDIX hydrolase [Actinomycetota bacterium]|nr:NUDIX hydrolase [Actinomycetota bacterium]
MSGFRTLGSRTIAEEAFLRLDRATVTTPDGNPIKRVVVVHPGAVAVVPIVGDDVIMIEQHRAAVGRPLLEIPAGKLDIPGEDRRHTAERELEEEIGFTPGNLEHLIDLLTTPGFSDECITIYLATDLIAVAMRPMGAEEHHARVVRIPLDEAVEQVRSGVITDAKTVAGLLLVAGR